jgi:hypothetical protein
MRYDESIIIRGVPILTSLKLRNIMSNEIQNFNIIVLCQLWNHEYKEPTIWECLIEPRKLASTNKSTFTVYRTRRSTINNPDILIYLTFGRKKINVNNKLHIEVF